MNQPVELSVAAGHSSIDGDGLMLWRLGLGGVVLAGDLYHYPEERTLDRVPTFEFDQARTRATRDMCSPGQCSGALRNSSATCST